MQNGGLLITGPNSTGNRAPTSWGNSVATSANDDGSGGGGKRASPRMLPSETAAGIGLVGYYHQQFEPQKQPLNGANNDGNIDFPNAVYSETEQQLASNHNHQQHSPYLHQPQLNNNSTYNLTSNSNNSTTALSPSPVGSHQPPHDSHNQQHHQHRSSPPPPASIKQRRLYRADENPPWLLTFLFGLQQVMVSVSVLVSIPFLISNEVCPGKDLNMLRVRLISATFVVCGIGTIIQSAFGLRLALLQGVAFAYIPSVRAFMSLPEFACNATEHDYVPPEDYESKMAVIQGTLMASSLVKMVIGGCGLVGWMTKYISPMTVSSLIILLMLSSVQLTVEYIEKHWISLVMIASLFGTVLYFARLKMPLPSWRDGRFQWTRVAVFGLFPYLTAILFSWSVCFVLTITDLLPPNSPARTDKNETLTAIANAPLIRLPYPGMFGPPRFNAGLFFAFLVSALTTLLEAVGNYLAVARVSDERPPPSHAINRGAFSEGLGCLIAGLIGPGVGITTHAENVGVIGITRVASRSTMIFGGFTLIFFGMFTKLGAILSAIPDPLVGVVLATSMAMVGGVAIANLNQVDLQNTRNVAILGFSIMTGMAVPKFYERNAAKFQTGIKELDQIIKVLLNLNMFVGAATACFLDNTVGGATRTQRGLRERGIAWSSTENGGRRDIYAFPPRIQAFVERIPIIRSLPLVPKRHKRGTHPGSSGVGPDKYLRPPTANGVAGQDTFGGAHRHPSHHNSGNNGNPSENTF